MKRQHPTLLFLLPAVGLIVIGGMAFSFSNSVSSQTPKQNANTNRGRPSRTAIQLPKPTPTPEAAEDPQDIVRIDTDLVKIDALVMQKNTARIVGGLNKEDFLIYEDGTKQEITHFSQDELPLSVLLVIDRGGCLNPYGDEVHRAAREAIDRLKPVDEIAVMGYASFTVLLQPFSRNRMVIENTLNNIPQQTAIGEHCLNNLFTDAANYMGKASNPEGRRVV